MAWRLSCSKACGEKAKAAHADGKCDPSKCTPEQKAALGALSPDAVAATELAGESITAKLTEAPGNGAAIGGLKVVADNGWFAARPSGTENIYKIYAESFLGEGHLRRIQEQAREIVSDALGGT